MNGQLNGPAQHKLRAPADDGGELVAPPLAVAAGWLLAPVAARPAIAAIAWHKLAAQARGELLKEAWRYTTSYRQAPKPDTTAPVILAGHQPQMFHPGVWCKNFLLSRFAQQQRATAVNLVVDNDTLKGASLRVPGGTVANPMSETVEFDAAGEPLPFEERPIADRAMFDSFGQRATQVLAPLLTDPMLAEYWPLVRQRSQATNRLGDCLAQARHQVEEAWGLQTLELPLSAACQLPAFQVFVSHMLARSAEFRQIHNAELLQYRRANRIRSAHHPVPELAADGDWIETPFWVWTAEDPRRRRLFAKSSAGEWLLTDRARWQTRLPADASLAGGPAVDALSDLARQGVKVRTKALTTTLWARLFLGDLFVHGIGGAKYDQLTDALIRAFFQIEPPGYLVATATLQLPIERSRVTSTDLRQLDETLRSMEFRPETFAERLAPPGADLPRSSELSALVAAKRAAIALSDSKETSKARCHAIRAANSAFQPWLADLRAQVERDRATLAERLRGEAVLASREYGFPLFPSSMLRNFLLEFPSQKAYT